jgi:hypothetical protein
MSNLGVSVTNDGTGAITLTILPDTAAIIAHALGSATPEDKIADVSRWAELEALFTLAAFVGFQQIELSEMGNERNQAIQTELVKYGLGYEGAE